MQIKELELENFKSFKYQKFTFLPGITALTGPNGSGKSNLYDAILFVLGNNSSNKLRYKKISDLICKDQKEKIANVRLCFLDGTSIERVITEDNSIFRLNGKRTTQEAIVSFLKEFKISSEGHNLVQQGNNKRIVDMAEIERKQLVEEIANVSLFDEQREKSEKNLEFVKQKIGQAKVILDERKSMLENLEKEKTVAEEYLSIKEQEEILKAVILKKEKQAQEHDLQRTQKRIETLQKNIPEEKKKINEISTEIINLEKELENQKQKYKAGLEKHSKLDAEYKLLEFKKQTSSQDIIALEETIKKKNFHLKELSLISQKQESKEIANLEIELKMAKQKLEDYDIKKLKMKQESITKEVNEIDTQLEIKQVRLYDAHSKLNLQKDNEKRIKQLAQETTTVETKIKDLESKIKNINTDEKELSKLLDQLENVEEVINDTTKDLQKTKEKQTLSKMEMESNKKEIELLNQTKSISSDLIVVNSEREIESAMKKNIEKGIYGAFFFVLNKYLDQVKSHIIVKTIDPKEKISELQKELSKQEDKIKENKTYILEYEHKLQVLGIKQKELKEQIKDLESKALHKDFVQSQLLYFNERKKDLQSQKVSFSVDPFSGDLKALETAILELQKKKQNLPRVDFEEYFNISKEYNKKQEELAQKKSEQKDLELQTELAKKEKEQISGDIKNLEKQINTKENLEQQIDSDFKEFSKNKLDSEEELKLLELDISNLENKIKTYELEKGNSNTNIKVYEQELEELRTNLFVKEETLTKKIGEIKKYIESNPNILTEKLEQEFLQLHNIGIKEMQNKYFETLSKLNSFGNVNLKSIGDYSLYFEKYNTIISRIEQLEKENEEIKARIKEIQAEKEAKFMNCFEKLNENFMACLKKLGLLNILLYLEHNELNEISGVNIVCGKRRTISLSGGEKVLVTISFLFSVLMLEPAPFYLLDEIDADLDPNNSEKVFNMLNEIAKDTQIFMITHNPVIVNQAQNVIGVSKSKSGITTVFVKQSVH